MSKDYIVVNAFSGAYLKHKFPTRYTPNKHEAKLMYRYEAVRTISQLMRVNGGNYELSSL